LQQNVDHAPSGNKNLDDLSFASSQIPKAPQTGDDTYNIE